MKSKIVQEITDEERQSLADAMKWGTFKAAMTKAHFEKKVIGPLMRDNDQSQVFKEIVIFMASSQAHLFDEKTLPKFGDTFRDVFVDAFLEGDAEFFNRVSKAIKHKPLLSKLFGTKLERYMTKFWIQSVSGVPELCLLTPDGLCDVIKFVLKNERITVDMVVKTRERLELPPFTRYKVETQVKGRTIIFIYPRFHAAQPQRKVAVTFQRVDKTRS